ncbi:MAG TPA: lytic murein transglycosylase [Roseiarcus sp.]|nr:lytic murein transglycosylase [Roseiarcus sp.]
MARIRNERRPLSPRRASFALVSVAIGALGLMSIAFSATAAANKGSNKGSHPHQAGFREFIDALWPLAAERGVSRAIFDRAFAGVSFDSQVVAMAKSQPEFVRPISDYVASALSADRIARGRDRARSESLWLGRAKETFGVDSAAILGIWGLETDFGGFTGSNNVFQALASLAYVHFRGDYFRDELLAALAMVDGEGIAPSLMRGSWAGAMGQTQFMPSSYLAYAVAFERHGRRDIWTSEADAIGSTANYLAKHGWTKGLPWGFEVRLPAAFALRDADSSSPAPFSSFAARGVKRADGAPLPESGAARLMILAGLSGPVFLVTSNFDVIKTYNNSTAYALAVGLLGDAVEGGPGLVAQWPADPPLTAAQIEALQVKLKTMGYDVGEIDGKIGDAMRSAVRAYQERNGLQPDGYADLSLFRRVSVLP